MKKILQLLLISLFATSAMAQQYNIPFAVDRVVEHGGETVYYRMDFDGTACADSSSGDVCHLTGGASGDCNTSVCPLDGSTYSGEAASSGKGIRYGVEDPLATIVALFGLSTNYSWMDAVVHITGDGWTGGGFDAWAMYDHTGGTNSAEICRVRPDGTTGISSIKIRSENGGAGTDSGTATISDAVTYWARIQFNHSTNECKLWMWSDDWGGTLLSGFPLSATQSASGNEFDFINHGTSSNSRGLRIDDVMVCNGSSAFTQGDYNGKCGAD